MLSIRVQMKKKKLYNMYSHPNTIEKTKSKCVLHAKTTDITLVETGKSTSNICFPFWQHLHLNKQQQEQQKI